MDELINSSHSKLLNSTLIIGTKSNESYKQLIETKEDGKDGTIIEVPRKEKTHQTNKNKMDNTYIEIEKENKLQEFISEKKGAERLKSLIMKIRDGTINDEDDELDINKKVKLKAQEKSKLQTPSDTISVNNLGYGSEDKASQKFLDTIITVNTFNPNKYPHINLYPYSMENKSLCKSEEVIIKKKPNTVQVKKSLLNNSLLPKRNITSKNPTISNLNAGMVKEENISGKAESSENIKLEKNKENQDKTQGHMDGISDHELDSISESESNDDDVTFSRLKNKERSIKNSRTENNSQADIREVYKQKKLIDSNPEESEVENEELIPMQKDSDSLFLVEHKSDSYQIWKILIISLIVFTTTYYPLIMAFQTQINASSLFIHILIDTIYFIDLIQNFLLTYVNEEDVVVREFYYIQIEYLKSYFAVDFIASLPISLFGISKYLKGKAASNNFFFFIGIKGCVKFMKIFSLIKGSFDYILDRVQMCFKSEDEKKKSSFQTEEISVSNGLRRLFKFIFGFLIISHIMSCLWIFLAKLTYPNWIFSVNYQDKDPIDIYIYAVFFHWTTIFTIGYGDVAPKNTYERLYTVALEFFGVMVYSFFISSLSNILANYDDITLRFMKNVDILNDLKIKYTLDDKFFDKISKFIKYDYKYGKHDKMKFFKELPLKLRNEMILIIYKDSIKHFKFFKYGQKNNEFISRVLLSARSMEAVKKEVIIKELDYFEEMIIVKEGVLSICLGHKFNEERITSLRKSEHFGDIMIFSKIRSKIILKVRSRRAELLMIKRSDLEDIFQDFTKICKIILKVSSANFTKILEMMDSKIKKIQNETQKQINKTPSMNSTIVEPDCADIIQEIDDHKYLINDLTKHLDENRNIKNFNPVYHEEENKKNSLFRHKMTLPMKQTQNEGTIMMSHTQNVEKYKINGENIKAKEFNSAPVDFSNLSKKKLTDKGVNVLRRKKLIPDFNNQSQKSQNSIYTTSKHEVNIVFDNQRDDNLRSGDLNFSQRILLNNQEYFNKELNRVNSIIQEENLSKKSSSKFIKSDHDQSITEGINYRISSIKQIELFDEFGEDNSLDYIFKNCKSSKKLFAETGKQTIDLDQASLDENNSNILPNDSHSIEKQSTNQMTFKANNITNNAKFKDVNTILNVQNSVIHEDIHEDEHSYHIRSKLGRRNSSIIKDDTFIWNSLNILSGGIPIDLVRNGNNMVARRLLENGKVKDPEPQRANISPRRHSEFIMSPQSRAPKILALSNTNVVSLKLKEDSEIDINLHYQSNTEKLQNNKSIRNSTLKNKSLSPAIKRKGSIFLSLHNNFSLASAEDDTSDKNSCLNSSMPNYLNTSVKIPKPESSFKKYSPQKSLSIYKKPDIQLELNKDDNLKERYRKSSNLVEQIAPHFLKNKNNNMKGQELKSYMTGLERNRDSELAMKQIVILVRLTSNLVKMKDLLMYKRFKILMHEEIQSWNIKGFEDYVIESIDDRSNVSDESDFR